MTTKKQSKVIPIEKIILLLAASFAAYNFGLAGGYIEGTSFSIGGLIAGVVVNITIAVAASRFGALKGNKRTRQALVSFIGMLFLSPLLVSPVIFYSLPETFLGTWWLRASWSVAWPLVADLAIVLAGAVSGKGLIEVSEQSAKSPTHSVAGAKSASDSPKSATKVRRTPSHSAKSASDSVALRRTYPSKCEHCDAQIQSPNAVGAHMKKHHPELCKPSKSLADALFTPVEKKP